MRWGILIELELLHDYYGPNVAPVTVRPADPDTFDRADLLLRQSGARVFVLAEEDNSDLPATVTLDLEVRDNDVVSFTSNGSWTHVPQITFGPETNHVTLGEDSATDILQLPGRMRLAQVTIALKPGVKRDLKAQFAAVASHWAYHVIGPGNEDVVIEDTEGDVLFEEIGSISLPDGRPAHVIRSRAALPARARPLQRFSLSRPGPFGPRTIIPVLPAPQPLFAQVPAPDGAGAIIQSDIYVSIF